MSNQSIKEVKLQPKYRSLTYGQKIVPELKISGVWLEEQGFYAGQLVEITPCLSLVLRFWMWVRGLRIEQ